MHQRQEGLWQRLLTTRIFLPAFRKTPDQGSADISDQQTYRLEGRSARPMLANSVGYFGKDTASGAHSTVGTASQRYALCCMLQKEILFSL